MKSRTERDTIREFIFHILALLAACGLCLWGWLVTHQVPRRVVVAATIKLGESTGGDDADDDDDDDDDNSPVGTFVYCILGNAKKPSQTQVAAVGEQQLIRTYCCVRRS